MSDLLSAGFLMIVIGVGGIIWYARKPRADREAMFGRIVGG